VADATRQAQRSLSTAISVLRDIAEDETENSQARVSAARSILEYGLKMTEILDIVTRIEELEQWRAQDEL